MHIDIWSDIVCPFCYIGKRHLETALSRFEGRDRFTIRWHSFELDPQAATEPKPVIETLMAKYGQSREQILAMMSRVKGMGAEAGLELRLEDSLRVNSFQAHRLVHLAAHLGKQDEAVERLMRAYFTEGEDLGNPDTLARLLDEIGIDEEAVMATLESSTYTESVRADERRAAEIGISGVPFFLFDDRFAISGAQPVSVFLDALARCAPPEAAPAVAPDPEQAGLAQAG